MQQEATVKNQQAALKLVKVRWCPLWRGRCVRRCNFNVLPALPPCLETTSKLHSQLLQVGCWLWLVVVLHIKVDDCLPACCAAHDSV